MDTEKNLISAFALDSENLQCAIEAGMVRDWFSTHRKIFSELVELLSKKTWNQGNGINVLSADGMFDRHPDLMDIFSNVPEWALRIEDVEGAIDVLRVEYAANFARSVATGIIAGINTGENPFDVSSSAMSQLDDVCHIGATNDKSFPEVVDAALETDLKIAHGEPVGLPFPWPDFQRKTFGIPLRAVTPLTGRDGTGKSRLATFLAEYWLSLGIPGLYMPFEDTAERFATNLAATAGRYDTFSIKNGNCTDYFLDKHKASMQKIKKFNLDVYDSAANVELVVTKIASVKRKVGIKWVVIDGFKDLISRQGENRTMQENYMMQKLTAAASKYGVAILVIMHLTKVDDETWISRKTIKGSSNLNQSARMVLVYQDYVSEKMRERIGGCGDYIVLDAQKASYGHKSAVGLVPNLYQGRFDEVSGPEIPEY